MDGSAAPRYTLDIDVPILEPYQPRQLNPHAHTPFPILKIEDF